MSSALNASTLWSSVSSPWTRYSGAEPTFRCRSEPSLSTSSRSAALTSNMPCRSAIRQAALNAGGRLFGASAARRVSGDVAELLRLGERLQLLQRLVLDLAD